jgi:hypothetical protein
VPPVVVPPVAVVVAHHMPWGGNHAGRGQHGKALLLKINTGALTKMFPFFVLYQCTKNVIGGFKFEYSLPTLSDNHCDAASSFLIARHR